MSTMHESLSKIEIALKSKISSNSLTLDSDSFGSGDPSIDNFWSYFEDQQIVLTDPVFTAENSQLVIQGAANTHLLGVALSSTKITLSYSSNKLIVSLNFVSEENWTLAIGFPQLASTYFKNVSFYNGLEFVLTNDLNVDPSQGVGVSGYTFTGKIQVAEPLEVLSSFIPTMPKILAFSGTAYMGTNGWSIEVRADLPDCQVSIADFVNFSCASTSLALIAKLDKNSNNSNLISRCESTVTLDNGKNKPVSLPLFLGFPSPFFGWSIGLQDGQDTSIEDCLDFLSLLGSGGNIDIASLLPNDVSRQLEGINLEQFDLILSKDFKSVDSLSLTLYDKNINWVILSDVLELQSIQVALQLQNTSNGFETKGWINGTISLSSDLVIGSTIPIPLRSGYWSFLTMSEIQLPDLSSISRFIDGGSLSDHLPAPIDQLGNFTLFQLKADYDPISKNLVSFSLGLFSSGTWTIIPHHLELNSLTIAVTLTHSSGNWHLSGRVQGTLAIGNIPLEIEIYKSAPNSDWNMYVTTKSIELPSLDDLANLVGGKGIVDRLVPQNIADAQLTLVNPQIDIDISKRKLTTAEFDIQLNQLSFDEFTINQVSCNLQFDWTLQPSTSNCDIDATFTIGDVDLYISGNYFTGSGWLFTGSTGSGQSIDIGTLMADLANMFGIGKEVPAAVSGMTIDNLSVSFDTQSKNFTFGFSAQFPVDGTDLDATIYIALTRNQAGTYDKQFSGQVDVSGQEFDLIIAEDSGS